MQISSSIATLTLPIIVKQLIFVDRSFRILLMRISLYLMTQKGFDVLKTLIDHKFVAFISEVIVGRDLNIDHDFADEIISLCHQHHITCYDRKEPYEITSEYSLAVSWRWLITDNSSKLIILHDSLLPKYRGFAALVNMLINKEEKIGVTALFASEEYDKGDIISQSSTNIEYPITISEAISKISEIYIKLVLDIFSTLKDGKKLNATKQEESLATYSLWRDEEDYNIDWTQDSNKILTIINAVSSPYKGASTFINGTHKIRILEAVEEPDVTIEHRDVGKIIFKKGDYPVIVCGSGLLMLKKVLDEVTQKEQLPFQNFRIRLGKQY